MINTLARKTTLLKKRTGPLVNCVYSKGKEFLLCGANSWHSGMQTVVSHN